MSSPSGSRPGRRRPSRRATEREATRHRAHVEQRPDRDGATGSAPGFKLADVQTVYAALPDAYKPNASWVMAPSAFRSLAFLTDSAGGLVLPSLHAAEPTLLGRPVYVSPELPTSAANARSLVFGDIAAGYAVRRQRGLGLQKQLELYSNQGQTGYLLFTRVDGRVVLSDAVRILVHSAT